MQPASHDDFSKCFQCKIGYDFDVNFPNQQNRVPMKVCQVHRICLQCFKQMNWKACCPICKKFVPRYPEKDIILLKQCVSNRLQISLIGKMKDYQAARQHSHERELESKDFYGRADESDTHAENSNVYANP